MSVCARCRENEATVKWGDLLAVTHGFVEMWCERCATEVQLYHAQERAAVVEELVASLKRLGGPAAFVACNKTSFVERPKNSFIPAGPCGLRQGHADECKGALAA